MVVLSRGIELDLDPDLQMNELIFIMNSNAVKNEAGAGSERSSRTKSWVRVSGAPILQTSKTVRVTDVVDVVGSRCGKA